MKQIILTIMTVLAAAAAFAEEATYEPQAIGAGTFTFTQPRALRAGPDGSVYMIEGDSDWATARRIAPDLASSQRFSPKVVTPDNAPAKWFHPAGLHPTPSGDLLVADTGRKRILRLSADGEFKTVVVTPGAPANLAGPTDALELPSGDVVVCDSASSRVLLFGAKGEMKRIIASEGTGDAEVNHPFSLALDREGNLWIADTLNRRLVVRGPDFRVKRVIRPTASGGPLFAWISYVDFDREGNALVADDGRSCVFRISPAGKLLARLGMREGERQPFARVSGVAALPDGTVLACDLARSVLVRFASDGKVLGEIGFSHTRGRGNGIVAAGVDRSGGFYLVGARQASLIRRCDADGVVRAEFGGEGTEPGKLLRPRAAAVGPDGNLYVADSELHRVTVYRSDGALVRVFGQAGKGASDIRYPRAIACPPGGLVFVGDTGNRRVQVFKATGEFVRTFATGLNPFALDVDPQGRVAVYDDADAVVATFDAAGRELARVSVREVEDPAGMALAADGKVWMLERRRGLVKAFAAGSDVSETVLRDDRAVWRGLLARGADGRIFIASNAGILPIEEGRAGAFVEARLPFEPGKLLQPSSLALVWGDELAVLSGPTGVVQVFGRDGAFRRALETEPQVRGIARIASGPGGDLLALSALDGALYRVAKDGRATQVLSADGLRGADAFALAADGKLWVNRDPRGGLVLLAPDGKELGGIPSGRDRHRWGRNVAATSDGDALVTEKSSGTVACYAQDLSVRWTLDVEKLDEPARLRGGIAAARVDAAGNLILLGADWSGIRILNSDRALVAAIRTDGALGSLSNPSDFALDADGSLYVADTGNNRVVKFVKRVAGDR